VDVTLGEVRRRFRSRAAPLGRPLPGVALHLVDPRRAPVPDGFPGEIAVAGPTLALGYLDDPAATAAAFVPDPFAKDPGARLYLTGDVARVDADGELEFLGRLDGQVKVRGQRVELGEIESALASHPSVLEAAAVLRQDGPEGGLVGYVVPKPGRHVAPEELAAYLRARLPSAMVPARWSFARALPRLPSGKLDRRALPAPAEARGARHAYEAPRTEVERTLAGICASVLRVPRVGVHDNLFEIGADSLSVQVIANRAARAGIAFPVSRLLVCQTIGALVESRDGSADAPSLSSARAKAEAVRRGGARRDSSKAL
jgi:hypothetical protein